jgi:hypothetical protein
LAEGGDLDGGGGLGWVTGVRHCAGPAPASVQAAYLTQTWYGHTVAIVCVGSLVAAGGAAGAGGGGAKWAVHFELRSNSAAALDVLAADFDGWFALTWGRFLQLAAPAGGGGGGGGGVQVHTHVLDMEPAPAVGAGAACGAAASAYASADAEAQALQRWRALRAARAS